MGGVLILLGGLLELSLFTIYPPAGGYFFFTVWFTGLLGLATGPAIIVLSAIFYHHPDHPGLYGSLIVGLSVASFLSFFGGFFVGTILGICGGVLVIVWRPLPFVPAYYPAVMPYASYRTCPRCGRAVVSDSRFCSYCGSVFT